MINKRRFFTNTGRKLVDIIEDPMNISFADEGKLYTLLSILELFVAISWVSFSQQNLLERKYGDLILINEEGRFNEETGNYENYYDISLDLHE